MSFSLVLSLSCRFGLFLSSYGRLFIKFLLAKIADDAVSGTSSLESAKRAFYVFVLADFNGRHFLFTCLCPKLNLIYPTSIPLYAQTVKSFLGGVQKFFSFYSVRRAMTGSFFAALLAGIKPLIKVSAILMTTIIIAELNGNAANFAMPVSGDKIALMPIESK